MSAAMFVAPALVAVAAAAGAVLVKSRRRAGCLVAVAIAAVAVLSALLGSSQLAGLLAMSAAGVLLLARRGAVAGDGGGCDDARPWRSLLPVVAFLALVLRPLLMTQWPLAEHAPSPVGFVHVLVLAVVLFSFGLFALIARVSVAGPSTGIALTGLGGALAAVAASHFLVAPRGGELLAGAAVLVAVMGTLAAAALEKDAGAARIDDDAGRRVAADLAVVVAGLCFALLVAVW